MGIKELLETLSLYELQLILDEHETLRTTGYLPDGNYTRTMCRKTHEGIGQLHTLGMEAYREAYIRISSDKEE